MQITTRITGLDQQIKELKRAERLIKSETVKIMRRTAKEIALPQVRAIAGRNVPSKFRLGATVRAKNNYVYITASKSRAGRVVGLLNWGGTIKKMIKPVNGKALVINGSVVKNVKTPRTYKPKSFLEEAATRLKPEFSKELEKRLAKEMRLTIERN